MIVAEMSYCGRTRDGVEPGRFFSACFPDVQPGGKWTTLDSVIRGLEDYVRDESLNYYGEVTLNVRYAKDAWPDMPKYRRRKLNNADPAAQLERCLTRVIAFT